MLRYLNLAFEEFIFLITRFRVIDDFALEDIVDNQLFLEEIIEDVKLLVLLEREPTVKRLVSFDIAQERVEGATHTLANGLTH